MAGWKRQMHMPQHTVKRRSPPFPQVALGQALAWSQQIYAQLADRTASRAEVAGSLGHISVSGPAASKLATLRAYGLIEPIGNGLRVSKDAITAVASTNPDERDASLRRLAERPTAFRALQQFTADEEKIRSYLIEQGFPSFAAKQAASVFIDTRKLSDSGTAAKSD